MPHSRTASGVPATPLRHAVVRMRPILDSSIRVVVGRVGVSSEENAEDEVQRTLDGYADGRSKQAYTTV